MWRHLNRSIKAETEDYKQQGDKCHKELNLARNDLGEIPALKTHAETLQILCRTCSFASET